MKKLPALVLFVYQFVGLFSQTQRFISYSIEEGLSQSVVNCVFQDNEGFLWVGTQDGLNVFDGYSFHKYIHHPHDSATLLSNWIYCVTQDPQGFIWVGTRQGLHKIEKRTGIVYRCPRNSDQANPVFNRPIYGIAVLPSGEILVNTPPVLIVYNPVTSQFKSYANTIGFNTGVEDYNLPVLVDRDNIIWLATTGGLARFDLNSKQFTNFINEPGNSALLSHNYVTALFEDREGRIWIGTKRGLNRYNKSTRTLYNLGGIKDINRRVIESYIHAITEDRSGNIWIGTDGAGLCRITSPAGSMKNDYAVNFKSTGNVYGPSHDIVLSLCLDKSDNLWVGTLNGLNKTDLKPKKFMLYRKSNDEFSVDLLDNVIASIYEDENRQLWVGNWGKGLNIYDRMTGKVIHYSTHQKGIYRIENDYVHVIFRCHDGNLWIGTADGLYVFREQNSRFVSLKEFYHAPHFPDFRMNRVYCILNDHDGNVWVGTRNGLYQLNLQRLDSKIYKTESGNPGTLSDNLIYSMLEDTDSILWVGTSNGLNAYDHSTGLFQRIFRNPEQINTISENFIVSLCEDYAGNLWIGTKSGVNRYDKATRVFTYFSEKEGLPSNVVYEILEDPGHRIWFTTGRGVSVYDPVKGIFQNFGTEDGLQSLEFNLRASFKSPRGEFFIGGMNGFNSFYPDSITKNPHIPSVVITHIRKQGKDGLVTERINALKPLVINPDVYEFTLEFAALEFTNPLKNRYAYMIEGLNDRWIDIAERRYVTFSKLPPGNYVFHVRGSNNDGLWNEQGTSVTLKVPAPWWSTRMAFIAYVLILFFALWMVIKVRERNLRQQKLLLEEEVKKRTLQIEIQKDEITYQRDKLTELNATKDRMISIIGHDMKTPLAVILSLSHLLLKQEEGFDEKEWKEAVRKVYKSSSQGLELLDNLLKWAKAQRNMLEVNPSPVDVRKLVQENIELYRDIAGNKNIELMILTDKTLKGYADIDMVNTVIRNLVSNALKFTEEQGKVMISWDASYDRKSLEVKVADTGMGISQENLKKLFRVEEHFTRVGTRQEKGTGIGLLLCKELVEKNEGRIGVKSEAGKGSEFFFTIPLFDELIHKIN
jgi:ligand-binding sensor domain-containing protein/signal transduction histidine kinase